MKSKHSCSKYIIQLEQIQLEGMYIRNVPMKRTMKLAEKFINE
jgi:hypothetical protein